MPAALALGLDEARELFDERQEHHHRVLRDLDREGAAHRGDLDPSRQVRRGQEEVRADASELDQLERLGGSPAITRGVGGEEHADVGERGLELGALAEQHHVSVGLALLDEVREELGAWVKDVDGPHSAEDTLWPMLRRRAFLGTSVRETESGIEVTRVFDSSMAAAAGLRAGDFLIGLGEPVRTIAALVEGTRTFAGRDVKLEWTRDGQPQSTIVEYLPFPSEETAPGVALTYGEVESARTILAAPDGADTVVVFLPGIDYASVDYALREGAPTARFLADLGARGLATYRVERPGLGDSPGPRCEGFLDEQALYRAGLSALRGFERVVLFGHSVGGMHAPGLADLADAFIVYGSSAKRWTECLDEGAARQFRLRGVDADEIAKLADEPRPLHGRSARFHEELDALDLGKAWSRVEAPRLVVIGGLDWVVGDAEQRAIASPIASDVVELEGLDHAFTRHESLEASLEHFGRGSYDPRLAEACARWLEVPQSPATESGETSITTA